MAKLFRNKYRIPSARASWWDYGWTAAYFVTICIQNRECFFGNVMNREMRLTEIGTVALSYWLEIPQRFPYAQLGAFVVMPNHMHGIVIIDKPIERLIASLPRIKPAGGFAGNKNPMLHDNLSRIIRWYKGRVSFESRKINAGFAWQSRFHDHIIRNNQSYHNISEYKQSIEMERRQILRYIKGICTNTRLPKSFGLFE